MAQEMRAVLADMRAASQQYELDAQREGLRHTHAMQKLEDDRLVLRDQLRIIEKRLQTQAETQNTELNKARTEFDAQIAQLKQSLQEAELQLADGLDVDVTL